MQPFHGVSSNNLPALLSLHASPILLAHDCWDAWIYTDSLAYPVEDGYMDEYYVDDYWNMMFVEGDTDNYQAPWDYTGEEPDTNEMDSNNYPLIEDEEEVDDQEFWHGFCQIGNA